MSPLKWIRHRVEEVKWFFQRGKRGWADCDCWSVDGYLAKIVPPMIRKLRTSEWQGYPEGWVGSLEEYDAILARIEQAFEQAKGIISYDIIYQRVKEWDEDLYQRTLAKVAEGDEVWKDVEVWDKETCARFEESFDLFKEFFFALWD